MSSKTFEPYHELDDEFKKSLTNIIWYKTKEECIRGKGLDFKEISLNDLHNLNLDLRLDVYYIKNNKLTIYVGIAKDITEKQLIFEDKKIDINTIKKVIQLLIKV